MVKSLEFSFLSYNECLISVFFFRFGQILFNLAGMFAVHHEKSFVPAYFKVSITDHLFDNLNSGKRNYCFGKKVCTLVLNFGSKTLYEPSNNTF